MLNRYVKILLILFSTVIVIIAIALSARHLMLNDTIEDNENAKEYIDTVNTTIASTEIQSVETTTKEDDIPTEGLSIEESSSEELFETDTSYPESITEAQVTLPIEAIAQTEEMTEDMDTIDARIVSMENDANNAKLRAEYENTDVDDPNEGVVVKFLVENISPIPDNYLNNILGTTYQDETYIPISEVIPSADTSMFVYEINGVKRAVHVSHKTYGIAKWDDEY